MWLLGDVFKHLADLGACLVHTPQLKKLEIRSIGTRTREIFFLKVENSETEKMRKNAQIYQIFQKSKVELGARKFKALG